MKESNFSCWICGSAESEVAKKSDIEGAIDSTSFAITDHDYGKTGEIRRCFKCGFLQCTDIDNVVSYYEDLEDQVYEEGREERALQADKLISLIAPYKDGGKLIDVGAGSGILVERANVAGFKAEGVEPSKWLQSQASKRGLNVHLGIFPHKDMTDRADVITIIDVIEHVTNPVELLRAASDQLSDGGIGIVVTPDVGSLLARILGWKWWHFRIAHIGYFNRKTLLLAFNNAGLEPVKIGRPCWYFPADYLVERVNCYLPRVVRFPVFRFLRKLTIPLNLRDSYYVIFRNKVEP